MDRTLQEKVRCMLSNTGLGKQFWAEAVIYASHLINRLPSRPGLGLGKERRSRLGLGVATRRLARATSRGDAQHAPLTWKLRTPPSTAARSPCVLCARQGRLCVRKGAQCMRIAHLTQFWVGVTVLVYCSLFMDTVHLKKKKKKMTPWFWGVTGMTGADK